MTIIRVKKTKNYTVMSNHHLRNKNLTLKTKGLLSLILSLPEDWKFSVNDLIALSKDNKTAVESALKELKENGYLVMNKLSPNQTSSGRFEYEYVVYETTLHSEKQDTDFLPLEILPLENLDLENKSLETYPLNINTIINTNKENNTSYLKENIEKSTEKVPRHRFGTYKRVLLTDKEYEKLLKDFGDEVANKQISLLDEYIESNNNKNGYTNYNLVIRKSIRENWFNRTPSSNNKNIKQVKDEPEWLKGYVDNFENGVEDL